MWGNRKDPLADMIAENYLIEAVDVDQLAKTWAKRANGFFIKNPDLAPSDYTADQVKWNREAGWKLRGLGIEFHFKRGANLPHLIRCEDMRSAMQNFEQAHGVVIDPGHSEPIQSGSDEIEWDPDKTGISPVESYYEAMRFSIQQLMAYVDPTGIKGKYILWILKQIVNEDAADQWLYEDWFSRGREKLDLYHRLKGQLEDVAARDINNLSMYSFIHSTEWLAQRDRRMKGEMDLRADEYEITYNSENYKIVIPKNHRAACAFGDGTDWCTAIKSNPAWFERYNKQGPMYIIIDKRDPDNKRWQFHRPSNQYMNKSDRQIDVMKFVKDNPEISDEMPLKELFRVINHPDGGKTILNNIGTRARGRDDPFQISTDPDGMYHSYDGEPAIKWRPIGRDSIAGEYYNHGIRVTGESPYHIEKSGEADSFRDFFIMNKYLKHPDGLKEKMFIKRTRPYYHYGILKSGMNYYLELIYDKSAASPYQEIKYVTDANQNIQYIAEFTTHNERRRANNLVSAAVSETGIKTLILTSELTVRRMTFPVNSIEEFLKTYTQEYRGTIKITKFPDDKS